MKRGVPHFFRYDLVLYDGSYSHNDNVSTGWTHIVINYIGPGGGTTRGIYVYFDGELEGDDTSKGSASLQVGNGRVVVGRHLPEEDKDYAGVELDELLVFNSNLNKNEINAIYNLQN